MENDFISLCCFMTSLQMCDKDHRDLCRKQFREVLLDIFDNKDPEHLIGVFRMYLKTRQLEDGSFTAYDPDRI